MNIIPEPSTTRWHGNFAGVHTLLRILLSSSAVLINIITGVSPAEIISDKIEIFSKHQRFLIAMLYLAYFFIRFE
jgi:hypothetical protein